MSIRVIDIVEGTAVDGPGLRTSIYLAGCAHGCPGCHNPQTWDFNAGKDMTVDELIEVITKADFNVTLTGGDPIYQAEALIPLAQRIRQLGYTIWLYTGFTFEQLQEMPIAMDLLEFIDTIIDGPFILEQRDTTLQFRGSTNQRIIKILHD